MKKELDLYRRYRRGEEGRRSGLLILLLPALAILTAGIFLRGITHMQNMALQQEVTGIRVWLEQQEARYHEAERKWTLNEALMERTEHLEALENVLSSYPKVTGALLDTIAAVGGERVEMTLTGYDAQTGALHFTARSREVPDIPDYVQALRQTGVFSVVDYSGYRYENDAYHLDIACTLRQGGAS